MSLARRAILAASRTSRPVFTTQTRAASSSSHDNHHEDLHHEDSTTYPAESFSNSFWRNVLLITAGTVALVKLAPVADKDAYLTRWIKMYATTGSEWMALNAQHTVQQAEVANQNVLFNDAVKPPVHRFRYPQAMMQASPFLNGIGLEVDMKGVAPKQGYDAV